MPSTFDQSNQTIYGSQTNIAGDQNLYFGGTPPGEKVEPQEALARLEQMPTDEIPPVADLPPGSAMLLRANALFVGREHELKAIASILKQGAQAAVLSGLGGVGKSQLASAFAHHYGHYFLGGVFWLSFANPDGVASEVARCALWIGGATSGVDRLNLNEQVNYVRQAWAGPLPRLLIFDNCEDPALFKAWRPTSGGCRVLVTSRRARWSQAMGVTTIPVGTLPRSQSVELLMKFLPAPDVEGWEKPVLEEVAAELGDLPLALHMAGSYLALMSNDGITPAKYLKQLRSQALLQHHSLQEGEEGELSPTDHELNVERTFALSYKQLQPDNPRDATAIRLLTASALLAPGEPIPRQVLRTAVGLENEAETDTAVTAIGRLLNVGLLEEAGDGALRLHRLLCHFVTTMLDTDALNRTQNEVEGSLLALANIQINRGDSRPLSLWQSHLRHLTDHAQLRVDERAAGLCNALGYHLNMVGEYKSARDCFERALVIQEKVLGESHPNTARILNNLGGLLHDMGYFVDARGYFERALAIQEKVLGESHPETATSLHNLGILAYYEGNKHTAADYLGRALVICEARLGFDHPDTQRTRQSLDVVRSELADE